MRLHRPAVLTAFVLTLATRAAAAPPAIPPPPTAEQIAAARAEGDALLKAAHAEDLFTNETGEGRASTAIILRHRASGFRCVLNPGKPQNRVVVARSLTRGDDVGCVTDTITDARELFFTKAPEMTPEHMLAEDIKTISLADPGAQVYTPAQQPPTMRLPPGISIPTPVTASLKGGKQGGHRVVVGKVGDWLVDFRFQGAPFIGDLGAVLDPFWTTTVLEARRHAATTSVGSAPTPPPTPATPPADRLASARSEADAILARASAADVFENVTNGNLPELRHKPSGFVCTFETGSPDNEVQVYPRMPRGVDVVCTTRSSSAINSRFVTKFPVALTADQAIQVYLHEIKTAHPDAKMAEGRFPDVTVTKPGAPPPVPRRTARLTYMMNGEAAFSRVSVAVVNGWVIEQRITAPVKDALMTDFMGEILMSGDVDRMSGRLVPPPPSAPKPVV